MNSGSFVVSANIMAAVHYKTFSNLTSSYGATFYPIGLVTILAGLYILVKHTKEISHVAVPSDECGYEEEEDTVAKIWTEASSLELTPVEEITIAEMAGLMSRRHSATKPRSRAASSSAVVVAENENELMHHPSYSHLPASIPARRNISAGSRGRTASSSSSVNPRDRASSTSSLQL